VSYRRLTSVPAALGLLFFTTWASAQSASAAASTDPDDQTEEQAAAVAKPAATTEAPPARKAAQAPLPPPAVVVVPEPLTPAMSKWQFTFSGFVELDMMRDSTQSFTDAPNNNPLMRSDGSLPAFLPLGTQPPVGTTYGSNHPRLQATARNSRFAFKIAAPDYDGIRTMASIDLDFIGNQAPNTGESAFFTNPTPRLRSAYFKAESDVIDVLVGQYYGLFGWQPLFFPATDSFLGIPNQIFGRTPQIRVSKTLKSDAVDVQLAVAALRPAQRDSGVPDVQGGLRVALNGWKGAHGSGSGQATVDAMSIGVSGVFREFRVAEFSNNATCSGCIGDPTTATKVSKAKGYGVSIDALIPIIPAKSIEDKGNALTLTGSFVTGAGIADLFTGGLTGGVHFPFPQGPGGNNTGTYTSNIDPGIVQYSLVEDPVNGEKGLMRVIRWQAYMAGLQYFLPPSGKLILTGNFSASKSTNLAQSVPDGGDPSRTFYKALYYDANVFADVTPAVRMALSYQHIGQTFVANNGKEKNERFELTGLYFF
jgi:hypothetical protein